MSRKRKRLRSLILHVVVRLPAILIPMLLLLSHT